MRRKRIYVAGPMTGHPHFNYPEFDRAALTLWLDGWDVENPTVIGARYGTPEEINASPRLLFRVIADELAAVAKCDAVFLLPGWQRSRGTRRELLTALRLGLEILTADEIAHPPRLTFAPPPLLCYVEQ